MAIHPLPLANEVNYWRTGRTSPDVKMDQVATMITEVGGEVTGKGHLHQGAQECYFLNFSIDGMVHRLVWPVLAVEESEDRSSYAARRQAVTFIYHEVKSLCVKAKVFGARAAFVPYLLLNTGKTISEMSSRDLQDKVPAVLLAIEDRGAKPGY